MALHNIYWLAEEKQAEIISEACKLENHNAYMSSSTSNVEHFHF